MIPLLLCALLATIPEDDSSGSSPIAEPAGSVFISTLPQLSLLQMDATAGLGNRFALLFGGWNQFDLAKDGYLRGAYLGFHFNFVQGRQLMIRAGVRGLVAEPWIGEERRSAVLRDVVGGVSAIVESRIGILPNILILPEFEFSWLPNFTRVRFSTEVLLALRDFRFGVAGGFQLWAIRGAVEVAPALALTARWIRPFGPITLFIQGTAGFARDPSFVTRTPSRTTPDDAFGFVGQLGVGFIANPK